MVNPFDKTFFRFVLGFSLILSMSFAILFFVNRYESSTGGIDIKAVKSLIQIKK